MGRLATLPSIADAKLPDAYLEAQRALAKCAKVDECEDWPDNAAALASYARQANDDSLRTLSTRIQARAIRRCGELLKQMAPQPVTPLTAEQERIFRQFFGDLLAEPAE